MNDEKIILKKLYQGKRLSPDEIEWIKESFKIREWWETENDQTEL